MKVTPENLSKIEWKSIIIENIDGIETLILICTTAEQSINLFKIIRDNNYIFTVEKENNNDCFVLLFDEYELWFEPKVKFAEMHKLRDGLVTKITTAFKDDNDAIKVNIEVLDLVNINYNLN